MAAVPPPLHKRVGISERTLRDHLRYGRALGRSAALLLSHIRNGRILPDRPCWSGFRFSSKGDVLECDNGTAVTPGQISQLTWILQMLDGAHRENKRQSEIIKKLEEELRGRTPAANDAIHHRW